MTKVFISYARSDQEFALRLAKALEADGFDIWIDQLHIETGRHWDTEIQTALELCPAFLLILSPASVASRNVQDEVSFALELEKDIVPVLYQPCNIPFRVRRHQYVDFTVGEEQGLAKFLESLKRLKAPKQPMVRAVGNVKTWPTATVNQGDLRRQEEAQYRAEGRIKIDAKIVHGASDGWFKPGAGQAEWFQDMVGGPEMVVVPNGSFMMGSPEDEPQRESWQTGTESPQHTVTHPKPFAVGRHAITRGQFVAFVNETGHKTEGGALVWTGSEWKHDPKASWRAPGFQQDDSHPVVCVNLDDAKAFTTWLAKRTGKTYRLLTEAEWEYAARAGTMTPFWWGASITPSQANYNGNGVYEGGGAKGEWRKKTVPVASFEANPWGLFNVHGNCWEWCEDVWHDSYIGAPTDGSAWLQGGEQGRRVVRGGSWGSDPQDLRSANRGRNDTVDRDYGLGFRLGRTLTP